MVASGCRVPQRAVSAGHWALRLLVVCCQAELVLTAVSSVATGWSHSPASYSGPAWPYHGVSLPLPQVPAWTQSPAVLLGYWQAEVGGSPALHNSHYPHLQQGHREPWAQKNDQGEGAG